MIARRSFLIALASTVAASAMTLDLNEDYADWDFDQIDWETVFNEVIRANNERLAFGDISVPLFIEGSPHWIMEKTIHHYFMTLVLPQKSGPPL
jgi:hypothetical protein